MAGKTKAALATEQEEAAFSKEQIAKAGRYKHRQDLVNALLSAERTYTLAEVDELIDKFMNGAVT